MSAGRFCTDSAARRWRGPKGPLHGYHNAGTLSLPPDVPQERPYQTALDQPMSVLAVEPLVQCGQGAHPLSLPAERWFMNLNTAGDLRRAENQRKALRACALRIA